MDNGSSLAEDPLILDALPSINCRSQHPGCRSQPFRGRVPARPEAAVEAERPGGIESPSSVVNNANEDIYDSELYVIVECQHAWMSREERAIIDAPLNGPCGMRPVDPSPVQRPCNEILIRPFQAQNRGGIAARTRLIHHFHNTGVGRNNCMDRRGGPCLLRRFSYF